MIRLAVEDNIQLAEGIYIFPAGSGGSDTGSASWAFNIICMYNDGSNSLHGFTADRVTLNSKDVTYIGADHYSSFTSEMSAFFWALVWILQSTSYIGASVSFLIGYDNTVVADVAMGKSVTDLCPKLAGLTTGLGRGENTTYTKKPHRGGD